MELIYKTHRDFGFFFLITWNIPHSWNPPNNKPLGTHALLNGSYSARKPPRKTAGYPGCPTWWQPVDCKSALVPIPRKLFHAVQRVVRISALYRPIDPSACDGLWTIPTTLRNCNYKWADCLEQQRFFPHRFSK